MAKIAKEALKESVVPAPPVGIGRCTADRIVEWMNEELSHITWYTPDELIGQSSRILYESDDEFLRVDKIIYDHPSGRRALNTRWMRKDGLIRDVELRAAWVDERDISAGIVFTAQDITERLQSQAYAAEAQSTITAVIESTEDMIWTVDPERFGLLTFNSALEEYFRYSVGHAVIQGMNPHDMVGGPFTQEVAEQWCEFYRRALNEGPFSEEYGVSTGTKIVLLSFSLLRRDNHVFGISVFAKDITERKRHEEALRESEEKYRAVVENANDGIIIVQDGMIIYANQRMAEMNGSTIQLLTGTPIADHIRTEDVDRVDELNRHSMAGEKVPSVYQTALKRADGSLVYAEMNVGTITYQGRQAALATFRDVSERKRLEENIRNAAEEWQATFDAVPDLIMMMDKDRRILRTNRAALSFFSKRNENVVGNFCFTLMHQEGKRPPETCPVDTMLKSKKPEEIEFYDEKRKSWYHISADPILDETGEISRIIHRIRDITDRKKSDIEAFNARREMLRLERLLLMGELSASLAHELNQPLTSILSNARAAARLLEAGKLTHEELKAILDDIARDDKRAGDIIRSLRSLLKVEEGEAEIINMVSLLHEVVNLFNSEAILRNISVNTYIPVSLPPVRANRVQIQQVLVNLMMNAAEAIEGQPVSERSIILRAAARKDSLRVSVTDSGNGINGSDSRKLFEPFFTTKASGLGMGLSLSRSIVEAHHGHIWAKNHEHGGAVFYFDLPISTANRTE